MRRLARADHPEPVEDRRQPSMRAPTAVGHVIALQRSAGNAAVTALLQREETVESGTQAMRITIGTDVTVELARAAQAAAAHGMTDESLRRLRAEALSDETISDAERMFIAALYDPATARMLGSTAIEAGVTVELGRSAFAPHLAHVRDLEQQAIDPDIGAELSMWKTTGGLRHLTAVERGALTQMARLVGPVWLPKVRAALEFAGGRVSPVQILEAMLAAASDDTEGDRALAAVVYVVAVTSGDPMAENVRTGRIKVDQVEKLKEGRRGEYGATATLAGDKGDTIVLPTATDIGDVADRGAIVHELRHAAADAAEAKPTFAVTERDAYEADAYRAGARYELEEVADMSVFARMQAVRQIARELTDAELIAMILVCQSDPERFLPVVEEVYAAWPHARDPDGVRIAMAMAPNRLEQELRVAIRVAYRIFEDTNTQVLDSFAGENYFDTADRR